MLAKPKIWKEPVMVDMLKAMHCATAFSMHSCAESAYQPYADEYLCKVFICVHMQTSAYEHFKDTHLHMVDMQTLHNSAY